MAGYTPVNIDFGNLTSLANYFTSQDQLEQNRILENKRLEQQQSQFEQTDETTRWQTEQQRGSALDVANVGLEGTRYSSDAQVQATQISSDAQIRSAEISAQPQLLAQQLDRDKWMYSKGEAEQIKNLSNAQAYASDVIADVSDVVEEYAKLSGRQYDPNNTEATQAMADEALENLRTTNPQRYKSLITKNTHLIAGMPQQALASYAQQQDPEGYGAHGRDPETGEYYPLTPEQGSDGNVRMSWNDGTTKHYMTNSFSQSDILRGSVATLQSMNAQAERVRQNKIAELTKRSQTNQSGTGATQVPGAPGNTPISQGNPQMPGVSLSNNGWELQFANQQPQNLPQQVTPVSGSATAGSAMTVPDASVNSSAAALATTLQSGGAVGDRAKFNDIGGYALGSRQLSANEQAVMENAQSGRVTDMNQQVRTVQDTQEALAENVRLQDRQGVITPELDANGQPTGRTIVEGRTGRPDAVSNWEQISEDGAAQAGSRFLAESRQDRNRAISNWSKNSVGLWDKENKRLDPEKLQKRGFEDFESMSRDERAQVMRALDMPPNTSLTDLPSDKAAQYLDAVAARYATKDLGIYHNLIRRMQIGGGKRLEGKSVVKGLGAREDIWQ